MFPLRWIFVFFLLGSTSLVSALPALGKALGAAYPQTAILHRQLGDGARNFTVQGSANKRSPSFADPDHIDETWMILVNASPYLWTRGYIHQYQMPDWLNDCPKFIRPGESASVLIQPTKGAYNWADSAAEVEYHLAGTSDPMSFVAKFSNKGSSSLEVEFRGALSSLNNARGSNHDLGVNMFPSGSAFILAGKEDDFITNDPPIDWMQAMLPELADTPLREILLPRSHHSGLWTDYKTVGLATPANTQTQTVHLRDQLGNGGIRVLDLRPLRVKDDFREVHGVRLLDVFHGVLGASLSEMIQYVNEFNRKYPGELIIWDVHGTEAWNGDHGFRHLDQRDREALYAQFMKLENRVSFPSDDEDVTQWPLGRFIGNKTSAVIVNIDESWRRKDGDKFPGGRYGFVTGRNFPLSHPWSNTDDVHQLVADQVREFRTHRPVPQTPIHVTEWILTQQGINAAIPVRSILELAAPAWRTLFEELWRASTSDSYPSWVSVDNVRGNQHKSLVMAMNHCLVTKKCGDLGGKVRI